MIEASLKTCAYIFGFPYLSLTLISLYLVGSTKNEARDKATQETLDMLSKKCYTILVKNKYLSAEGETIDANELSDPLNPKNDSKPAGYAIKGCILNTYEFQYFNLNTYDFYLFDFYYRTPFQ
jgi:hypothetical protein